MKNQNLVRILSLTTTLMLILLIVVIAVIFTVYTQPQFFKRLTQNPALWAPKSISQDLPDGREGKIIKYGYLLASETPKYIGPHAKSPKMRYAGNNLACKNCHLESGATAGSASWVGVTDRYPQFRGRENKVGTIEERINGCMERSMNGDPLPVDSDEMSALVAYMEWLSDDLPDERIAEYKGFPSVEIPDLKMDTIKGKAVYLQHCQVCHGEKGEGLWLSDSTKGYQYPPLWGKDSYNHGAGMNRVITAAQFIKGNMPWGQATAAKPVLTDEEALHVAAYINSFQRPLKDHAEKDFPERKLKPVSTPYGPWDDPFPASQHKYGPYKPIIDYYQQEHKIKKTK